MPFYIFNFEGEEAINIFRSHAVVTGGEKSKDFLDFQRDIYRRFAAHPF